MKLTARRMLLFVLVMLTVPAVRAADPAYVGKWKFNQAKSTITGDTVTIGSVPGGMMQFSSQGFSYSFKLDGKEYPMPDGGTTAWTATSPDVWDVVNRMSGKVAGTFHLALKGDTLSVAAKMMKPEGGSMDFSAAYTRVSGGPGFAGKWMSTEVKMPATLLEIVATAPNGVTLKNDGSAMLSGQFDGKDHPGLGMMAGSKNTFVFRKISDRSFEVTTKVDGKPMYVEVYTVSADGKTLTDEGTPTNAKQEPFKMVFDRQQ